MIQDMDTREMQGRCHTVGILKEYAKSMGRVWVEYAKSMARVWVEYGYTFLTRGNVPCEISLCSNEIASRSSRDYVSFPTRLRLVVLMFLMMVMGVCEMWGQIDIDFSGKYCIANKNGYNSTTPENNFYLVPATNSNYNGDTNQPHLTTTQSGKVSTSYWTIEKSGEYYRIIYADGRYLTANTYYAGTSGDAQRRLRVHLEQMSEPDNNTLFIILPNVNGGFNIKHKDISDDIYLDPAGGNIAGTNITNARTMNTSNGTVNVGGGIGYWTDEPAARWVFEDIVETPTVSINSDGKAVISSSNASAAYYYTTDGTTKPTTGSTPYTAPIDITGIETIKAIAVVNDEVSNVATFTVGNGTPYIIQNQECTAYYLISGDETQTNVPANTSSIYGPKIEWLLKCAGNANGIQYYYFVNNATGNYLYRTGNNVYVKAFDANYVDGYKFNFFTQNIDGSYNIFPKGVTDKGLYKKDGNVASSNVFSGGTLTEANAKWKFILTSGVIDKRTLFEDSPVEELKYYKIGNKNEVGHFILSPKVSGSTEYAGASNTETNDNMVWRFEEAEHDEWQTYYHIVHATTGKYMYYTGSATATSAQANAIEMRETLTDNIRYQFVLARATDAGYYYIIPKTHKDAFKSNQYFGIWYDKTNTDIIKTTFSRSSGANNVKWKFEETTTFIAPPSISFSEDDMKVTMQSTTENIDGMKYDFTTGTADAPSDATNAYPDGGIEIKYGPIYHFAAKAEKDGNTSILVTKDIDLSYIAVPTISVSGNTVTFSTTQKGITFYYTTDGSTPKYTVENAGDNNGTAIESNSEGTASITLGNDLYDIKVIAVSILDDANKTGYSSSFDVRTVDLRVATIINTLADIQSQTGFYKCSSTFSATGTPKIDGTGDEIGTSSKPFKGTLEGYWDETKKEFKAISLSKPLFNYVEDATIKNIIVAEGTISGSGNVGAIAGNALGATRIYNCGVLGSITENVDANGVVTYSYGSSVSGDQYVGGIVGFLNGSSRVINCYSYAKIAKGDEVGGIVGRNNVATTSTNLQTMVMNCMFYGDIDDEYCTSIAPIYNGEVITNRSDANGVSNFNYFWAGASYVQGKHIDVYNCALAAETRFLNRFEFFRHLLNSNRALAAWWATGSSANKDAMMKWVLEPSQIGTPTPYPILKAPDKYPSVVNIDADHAESFSSDAATKKTQYNQGRKFGELTIKIQMGTSGDGYHPAKDAEIIEAKKTVKPNITDKDPAHFNFNYYKVQLPYYNDVGTNNYRKDNSGVSRVVTGWKIVSISNGTHSFTTGSDATASVSTNEETKGDITLTTPYNFADRKSTAKDLYSSTNKRVFNQGAYFDVPEGVTEITIQPYWGKCVYVSDEYPDVVYDQDMTIASSVTTVGTINGEARYTNEQSYLINGESQVVYTSMSNAAEQMPTSGTVYDNAIVLVGNVHSLSLSYEADDKPYTIMSIDLDKDNEPDYSYILRFNDRKRVHPVRVDFLNVIGLGMAQKSKDGKGTYNLGIMQPYGWFECTNTALFRVTQFEYDKTGRVNSPMILQGGVIEQWVTVAEKGTTVKAADKVSYYHVGGNVWFKEFHIGVHQDKTDDQFVSPHPPISVTGGDFDEFYLTGLYNTPNKNYDDNAECYINGGRFGKVAGTGMQGLGGFTKDDQGNKINYSNGNIIWQIDNADIDEFYAGGINAAHIAEGNIYTVITNSRVDQFCGGPKFGNMNSDKIVVTNAENCTFRTFFGAGYGGNSYNRRYPDNKYNDYNYGWNTWLKGAASYDYSYDSDYNGVETRIDYQFIPKSDNTLNVARLFIDYVSFSLATTHDVTSKLTGCTITTSKLGRLSISDDYKCLGSFYGGGSLGKVDGPVKSTLTNCTVEGNVFGGGYSATLPTVNVMANAFQKEPSYDDDLGVYLEAKLPATTPYTWQHREEVNSTATAIKTSETEHFLYTEENLEKSNLGSVSDAVTLTLQGNTKVGTLNGGSLVAGTGDVYGGGDESYVNNETDPAAASTTVTIAGNTEVRGNVFGGGNRGVVSGTATVNIKQ